MTPLYKQPIALLGAAVGLTGVAIHMRNSWPWSGTCFEFGKPTPAEAAACKTEQGYATAGKVMAGVGFVLLFVGAVKATR